MTRLSFETGHMTRGTTQIARLCAPLQALTCPMHSRSIHGRRLLGRYCSDLRLGRDGMKLQPAGFHQSRLSAGPPAVPSSSQPCMKLNGFYHRVSSLSIRRLNFSCFPLKSRQFKRHPLLKSAQFLVSLISTLIHSSNRTAATTSRSSSSPTQVTSSRIWSSSVTSAVLT